MASVAAKTKAKAKAEKKPEIGDDRYEPDTIGILYINPWRNKADLAHVIIPWGELKQFVTNPTIASVHWYWQPAWLPEDINEIGEIIEEKCYELATPKRQEGIVKILNESDTPLTAKIGRAHV